MACVLAWAAAASSSGGGMTAIGPTTRRRLCAHSDCDAVYDEPYPWPYPWPKAYCSASCHRAAKTPPTRKPRTKLRPAPSTTKRKPVAIASREQAAKRAAGASIVSGKTTGLDAAHLCPRDLGGCSHELCVVPLTRAEHRAFDGGELDLLPYLVPLHTPEIAHALVHYNGDLIALLERLTGLRWVPVSDDREAA